MEFFNQLDKNLLIELVIGLLFVVYVVVYVIEYLKMKGRIGSGQAGKWSEGLNSFIGLIVYVALWLGAGKQIESVPAGAMLVASAVGYIIVAILGSKLYWELIKWVRGQPTVVEGKSVPLS